MSWVDNEVISYLKSNEIIDYFNIEKEYEEKIDKFNNSFDFYGSHVNWFKVLNHSYLNIKNIISNKEKVNHVLNFIESKKITSISKVNYIGDSISDFCYISESKRIFNKDFIKLIISYPQNHYFFPDSCDWCIAISFEDYIDYGEKHYFRKM